MLIFIAYLTSVCCTSYDSNTSHVNLYQTASERKVRCRANSNTSHVNLYHRESPIISAHSSIQIHLMLIFILPERWAVSILVLIQIHLMLIFIQQERPRGHSEVDIQIHLMLIFICVIPAGAYTSYTIQIHLMLIFIELRSLTRAEDHDSNTSHVNLYRIAQEWQILLL